MEEYLEEMGALVFENPSYSSALIGCSIDGNAIYDYDLMINYLVETDGMTTDEAVEFIDYNTLRTIPYMQPLPPIILYKKND